MLNPGGPACDDHPGWRFAIGIGAILLAALAFGAIAGDVVSGATITHLDVRIAHWFHARATPGLTGAMLVLTHVNGLVGTSVMAALLAAWFALRKARDWMLLTLVAVPGGMLLNVALKTWFQRARPSFDDPLLTLATYSFPSGHTAAATVFYGLAAYYVWRHASGPAVRVLAAGAAFILVALVALSRMYLGVHYLSDVLAAVAESGAWLVTCVTTIAALRRRRQRRDMRGQP
jgi:membrane-associated phospholipid phosphatase